MRKDVMDPGSIASPSPDEIVAAKREMRHAMRAVRDALGAEESRRAAEALAALADHPAFGGITGRTVAGYAAFRSEIDPMPLMMRLAANGARLALPRIVDGRLAFHAYKAGDLLETGPYGIRQPVPEAPLAVPDAILAPLLAFDAKGGRLGYGGGYYDRAFAAFPAARRIGIAYSVQQVETVPHEAHDKALAMILTDAGPVIP